MIRFKGVFLVVMMILTLPMSVLADARFEVAIKSIVFDPKIEGQFIGDYIYFTDFAERETSPEEAWVKFKQGEFNHSKQKRPNFGLSRSAHFGFFEIENKQNEPIELILENNFGMGDYFFLYRMDESENFKLIGSGGDQVPISNRAIIARTMNARITLEPGVNKFMFKTYGDTCLQAPIRLWTEESYRKQMNTEYLILGFLIGIHAIMIIYNTFLGFAMRDRVYLFYVICVGSNLIYHISNYNLGQYLSWLVFSTETYSNHIQLIAVDTVIISSILFSRKFLSFTKEDNKFIHYLLNFNIGLSVCNIIVGNLTSAWLTSVITLTSASICINFLIVIGILKFLQGYQPAAHYLMGWGFYLLGSWSIVAVNLGLFEATTTNYWGQFFGGALEISLFSVALGARLSFIQKNNHEKIKTLNSELQEWNLKLESKVEERTNEIKEILIHLHQGIFTIRGDLAISSEYSKYLETIFEHQELAGISLFDLLKNYSTLTGDELDQIKNVIGFSIDADETNFIVNRHCLPNRIIYKSQKGEEKYLDFEWINVGDRFNTKKILVSVRDSTEKLRLEKNLADRNDELRMISQLVEINSGRFDQFLKVTEDLLLESEHLLMQGTLNAKVIRALFINYHTLKGLSRTLNLVDLSELVHQAESALSQTKDAVDEISFDKIKEDFQAVVEMVQKYRTINREKLGRFVDPNFSLMPKKLILNLIHHFEEMKWNNSEVVQDISLLKTFYFRPIEDIVISHINSLKSIADQLDKLPPRLKFVFIQYGLEPKSVEAFEQAITHILRNCLDHGIEDLPTRLANGKPERGSIEFHGKEVDGHLELRIFDDGQGLDIGSIRAIGIERGLIDDSVTDVQVIADLIFHSGFSTKRELSTISGRGIGMDAVRKAVEQIQATISLSIGKRLRNSDFYPFEFVLRFRPDHYCRLEEHDHKENKAFHAA